MAKISLHDYLETVDQLLDEEQYHKASQHCYHILKQFPRHLETYKALAKAKLGEHKTDEAIDLFLRVLSADPNDLIAHIGLSDLYRAEQEDLSRWHLQRALDLEPYNIAIQEEYLKLTEQENGSAFESGHVPLSHAAMANIYLRSELYDQAKAVLHEALAQTPDRIDLEMLLAEALWRGGDNVDAADACRSILNRLPNAVDANAIVTDIWMHAGRVKDAAPFLARVQSLQPMDKTHVNIDSPAGRAQTAPGTPPLPELIPIEPLSETSEIPVSVEEPTAEWVSEISFDSGSEEPEPIVDMPDVPSEPGDMYDWLKGVTAELRSEAVEQPAVPAAEADADSPGETDWFVDPEAAEALDKAGERSATDWLGEEWQNLDSDKQSPPASDTDAAADLPQDASESDDMRDAFSGPIPDWLEMDDQAESEIVSTSSELGDMPDWLLESTSSDFDALQLDGPSASDWLSPPAGFEEEAEEPEAQKVTTDWLSSLTDGVDGLDEEQAEDDQDDAKPVDVLPDDETGEEAAEKTASATDWLEGLASEDQIVSENDWLTAVLEDESLASDPTSATDEDAADEGDEVAPIPSDDWLAEMIVSDDGFATEDDGWLSALSTADDGDTDSTGERDDVDAPAVEDVLAPELAGEDPEQQVDEASEADWLMAESDSDEQIADDWLADLAGGVEWLDPDESRASVSETELFGEEDDEETDDWLAALAGDDLQDSPAVDSHEPGETDDISDDWLAELAGDSEPESSLLEQQPAEEDDFIEEADDWLAQLEGPTGLLNELNESEAATMGGQEPEEKESEQKDVPQPEGKEPSTHELMDWLDELDAAEDEPVAPPVSEEPKPEPEMATEDMLEPESNALPDWLSEAVEDSETAVSSPADLPDWLEASDELVEEQALSEFNIDSTLDSEKEVAEPPTALLDELQAIAPEKETEPPDEAEDDISWLSNLTETDDLADTTYLDLLADEDDSVESESPLEWLDAVADEQEEDLSLLVEVVEDVEAETAVPPEPEEEPLPDLPDDLDDAMSWLEDLAAEESAPVEPLPTVAEVLDEDPPADVPDEPSVPEPVESDVDEIESEAAAEPDSAPEPVFDDAVNTELLLDFLDADSSGPAEELEESAFAADLADDDSLLDFLSDAADPIVEDEPESIDSEMLLDFLSDDTEAAPAEDVDEPIDSEALLDFLSDETEAVPAEDVDEPIDSEALLDFLSDDPEAEPVEDDVESIDSEALLDFLSDDPEAVPAEDEADPIDSEVLLDFLLDDQETSPVEDGIDSIDSETLLDFLSDDQEPVADEVMAPVDPDSLLDFLSEDDVQEVPADDASTIQPEDDAILDLLIGDAEEPTTDSLLELLDVDDRAAAADSQADDWNESLDTDDLDKLLELVPEEDEPVDVQDQAERDVGVVSETLAAQADAAVDEPGADELIGEARSDIDDAMSWLDEMAESSELQEEDVSLWDESAIVNDETESMTEVLAEAGLPTDADEHDEISAPEVPEDLDAAMAWLEELAAKQGAPLEELPSLQDDEPDVSTLDDVAEAIVDVELDEDDQVAAVETAPETALELESEMAGDEMLETLSDVPEDLDAAMAWLEELAANQGAPIEELPSLMPEETEAVVEPADDLEMETVPELEVDALEPEADPAESVESPPETVGVPEPVAELDPELADALDWLEAFADDEDVAVEEETAVLETPSDDALADALNKLEQFALTPSPIPTEQAVVDDDAQVPEVDELPSDLLDMPEDPDAALAWLEDVSTEETAPALEAPPTEVIEPEPAPITEVIEQDTAVSLPIPPAETDDAEELADEVDSLLDSDLFDFPEDPDAALAWLEEASTEDAPEIDAPEEQVTDDDADAHQDEAPLPSEEDLLSAVPEDPDEAMAWLEQLAARQGASLDELPTVSERPEGDVDAPDWIAAAAEAEPEPAQEELISPPESVDEPPEQPETVFDDDELLADLDISDIEAEAAQSTADSETVFDDDELLADLDISDIEAEAAQSTADADPDDDVLDDMPAWLGGDVEDDASMLGQTAWLQDLPEPDVTGWLEAEAAASSSSGRDETGDLLAETGPLVEPMPVDTSPIAAEEDADLSFFSDTDELSSSAFNVDEAQLESAQASLSAGEVTKAFSIYQELVSRGDGLVVVINELETAVSDQPDLLEMRRLLGDAYLRNGQLQKALTTYRDALDQL